MGSVRYLNTILTLLTLVLTLNLWTAWTGTPGGDALSLAQQEARAEGIPNAAAQRKQMTDLLKKVNVQLGELKQTMVDGKVRVRIEAMPDGQ